MPNTQALTSAFKRDVMLAFHAFGTTATRGATTADTFKAALYLATANRGAGDTVYDTTGEVSGTGYTAGGVTITNANPPALDGTTAHWTPSASIVYTGVTLSTAFDAVLIYNDSFATKRAVSVHTFGSQTVTAGNFTLSMPVNNGTTGLIRII